MATFLHMSPATTELHGPLRRPLSHILGTRAKVAALRALSAGGTPITQRELARRAGIQHRSAQNALEDLVTLGIVRRTEGGRDFLVSLNPNHHLSEAVKSLFRTEWTLFAELRAEVVEVLHAGFGRREIRGVALFGSAARAEEVIGSDLDILVVTATNATHEKGLDHLQREGDRLWSTYGTRVNVLTYSLVELRHRWRRRLPPLPEIVRDGIMLAGAPLQELLTGG